MKIGLSYSRCILDIADVIARLQKGSPIPVRYLLNSLPKKSFKTELASLSAVSAAADVVATKNIFKVTVPAGAVGDSSLLRAGYTGRARLEMGYKPVAYAATRRFLNWLRTHVFF